MEEDGDTLVNDVVARILHKRELQGDCIKSGEKSIQNNSLKNLLKVVRAWKNNEFKMVVYGKQYLELYKICNVIDRTSERTAYDYYQTLRAILNELNLSQDSEDLSSK